MRGPRSLHRDGKSPKEKSEKQPYGLSELNDPFSFQEACRPMTDRYTAGTDRRFICMRMGIQIEQIMKHV
ncbi:hypothetical protein DPMN_148892 [Dreissena polymorpha]|uniref:Uncharacterized protein n=1 Tax=Dreissena polymorpha TaxID=45954 RepID=A0A9D4FBR5_DREPO|nr:hypothetical protein DPMN_148892 [Dreissena polymorpha]